MKLIEFVIPLAPKTKKNSQRIITVHGRPCIIPSKDYKDYEKACEPYIPKVETIDFKVNVKCLFYMPTHRRCDLTNHLESIDDILVKYGVLEDDNCNILVSHDGSRVLYDNGNPRTEVVIEKYEN